MTRDEYRACREFGRHRLPADLRAEFDAYKAERRFPPLAPADDDDPRGAMTMLALVLMGAAMGFVIAAVLIAALIF